jgi:hypothetical protein
MLGTDFAVVVNSIYYPISRIKRYLVYRAMPYCAGCGIRIHRFQLLHGDRRNRLVGYSVHNTLFTLDHIQPRSKGGTWSLSNLQSMCTICNHKRGDREDWKYNPTKKAIEERLRRRQHFVPLEELEEMRERSLRLLREEKNVPPLL